MRYVIESTEDGCMETITFDDGKTYSKSHIRTVSGSQCGEDQFYEQMEKDHVCEELLDKIYDLFDSTFFVLDFMGIADMERSRG